MKNKNIITYIVGLLTGLLFIPVLEELSNVVLTWIEYLKIKPSKLLLKGNNELLKLQGESESKGGNSDTNAIGFIYSPETEDYYNEE